MDKKIVFENEYCKVVWIGGNLPYLLHSKAGKYEDHYYRDIIEVSRATMIPVKELAFYNPISG